MGVQQWSEAGRPSGHSGDFPVGWQTDKSNCADPQNFDIAVNQML